MAKLISPSVFATEIVNKPGLQRGKTSRQSLREDSKVRRGEEEIPGKQEKNEKAA